MLSKTRDCVIGGEERPRKYGYEGVRPSWVACLRVGKKLEESMKVWCTTIPYEGMSLDIARTVAEELGVDIPEEE